MSWTELLPVIFFGLMGLAMLAYVVLDGYDLGVGMLMHRADEADRDIMVASIGPFWDANETWLVLGVGILLIAFPIAHGIVLTALYLPVAFMLIGLILRGVAYGFRSKAQALRKPLWDLAFIGGSGLAAAMQGWMLGRYISGFAPGVEYLAFAAIIALLLPAAYVLLGAGWLIMKTEGELQRRAVRWAKLAWAPMVVGIGLISIATPWVSEAVRERWFSLPAFFALMPIPLTTLVALAAVRWVLGEPQVLGRLCWVPFAGTVTVFVLCAAGLAYSLFPYVIIDRITIWQAASAPESLVIILVGVAVTLPMIVAYTVFIYKVFHGKAKLPSYG
jgi:cytochrome d ubiquinol oxidase subunit II